MTISPSEDSINLFEEIQEKYSFLFLFSFFFPLSSFPLFSSFLFFLILINLNENTIFYFNLF